MRSVSPLLLVMMMSCCCDLCACDQLILAFDPYSVSIASHPSSKRADANCRQGNSFEIFFFLLLVVALFLYLQ
jgi:hypothetical protein